MLHEAHQNLGANFELRELQHRTRNNLQIVAALLRMQARKTTTAEAADVLNAAADRIIAFEQINTCLEKSKDGSASPQTLLTALAQRIENALIGSRPIRISVDACDLQLHPNMSTAIGLIANELVTNALKYAFPNGRSGKIVLICRCIRNDLHLVVKDNGIGLSGEMVPGLGVQLVRALVQQHGGTIETEKCGGLAWQISLPLDGQLSTYQKTVLSATHEIRTSPTRKDF